MDPVWSASPRCQIRPLGADPLRFPTGRPSVGQAGGSRRWCPLRQAGCVELLLQSGRSEKKKQLWRAVPGTGRGGETLGTPTNLFRGAKHALHPQRAAAKAAAADEASLLARPACWPAAASLPVLAPPSFARLLPPNTTLCLPGLRLSPWRGGGRQRCRRETRSPATSPLDSRGAGGGHGGRSAPRPGCTHGRPSAAPTAALIHGLFNSRSLHPAACLAAGVLVPLMNQELQPRVGQRARDSPRASLAAVWRASAEYEKWSTRNEIRRATVERRANGRRGAVLASPPPSRVPQPRSPLLRLQDRGRKMSPQAAWNLTKKRKPAPALLLTRVAVNDSVRFRFFVGWRRLSRISRPIG